MVDMRTARWGYVVLAFIQAAFTSGIIFGWTELETIFYKQGVYADHCTKKELEEKNCNAQVLFFNMIYTVGVFANNAAPLLTGIFLDFFGPKLTNLVSVVLFMGGCALFIPTVAYSYVPAFGLLGFAGPGVYVSIMHLNNLFPGHQASVLSFFSGTFTVSTFIFKVFRILNQDKEWFSMAHLFLCYIILLVPVFLVGGFIWPSKPFQLQQPKVDEEKQSLLESKPNKQNVGPSLYGAPLKDQLMAPELWLIILWMAITNLHISSFLGTVSNQFSKELSGIFTWMWEFGWIAIPAYGILLDKMGVLFTIFISNFLLLIYGVLIMLPQDGFKYAGFAIVSMVNVGVWGLFYTFLSKTFGFNNYGKLLGISAITIAVVGLLQYPILSITVQKLNGNYTYANLMFIFLTLVVFITPFVLWRREKRAKKRMNEFHKSSINVANAE